MSAPYYADESVTLWHGHYEELLIDVMHDQRADCIVTDPPYGETSLVWDRWPDGWPSAVSTATDSMWCFGSMRMFLDRGTDFHMWKMSQDVVWEKHRRSVATPDRFARIHEHAVHWYRGAWGDIHHDAPKVPHLGPLKADTNRSTHPGGTQGERGVAFWQDDGTRYQTTVIKARAMHRNGGINPTQKPLEVVTPLVTYACPPGGLVLDPFAGSGSTLVAARNTGRRAIGFEIREEQCELTAIRLSQMSIDMEGIS